jgi:hypothetical protein
MINKKDFLSQPPIELGIKDAVHVAIVSVRAGQHLSPGDECTMNEHGEAIKGKGLGVVSPFVRGDVLCGQSFWLMLFSSEVTTVKHEWVHPKFDFKPPTKDIEKNKYLERYAKDLEITYEQLMDACGNAVHNETTTEYSGTLSFEVVEDKWGYIKYDIWYEWADEANYEFANYGTECCPEYETPDFLIFKEKNESE